MQAHHPWRLPMAKRFSVLDHFLVMEQSKIAASAHTSGADNSCSQGLEALSWHGSPIQMLLTLHTWSLSKGKQTMLCCWWINQKGMDADPRTLFKYVWTLTYAEAKMKSEEVSHALSLVVTSNFQSETFCRYFWAKKSDTIQQHTQECESHCLWNHTSWISLSIM